MEDVILMTFDFTQTNFLFNFRKNGEILDQGELSLIPVDKCFRTLPKFKTRSQRKQKDEQLIENAQINPHILQMTN